MQPRTFEQEIEQINEYLQQQKEQAEEEANAHRSVCDADDCICHDPDEGDEVADGDWEPSGVVVGYDRNGLVNVEWAETQWVQGYPKSRFTWAIDHWQLVQE